ncbi:MAG TPA: SpoIIE family protein phosphatase [Rhodothermales bacterium]|nr:SpoIIE family protein phosphatase [Rhodothermales bacterium]
MPDAPTRVLVVDDEPDLEPLLRQRFRRRIREGELELVFACDGLDALDKLAAHPDIGLVLTDINMPRMDGLTLLGELARLDRPVRAVVVSAYGDLENIRTAMNRGAFDFITKPIAFDDLETTLDKTIRHLGELQAAMAAHLHLAAVEQELSVARRIQQAIVPHVPLTEGRVEVFGAMHPAREVGGDFYDYFWVDEERLGFAIGDVAGKGVPAALFMAVTRSVLKAVAMSGLAPGACLRHVNQLLFPESVPGVFVTVFYGVLNTSTGSVEYANAGHNPPVLLRAGGDVAALPKTGGVPVAAVREFAYASQQVVIEPGDGLLLYTDGVVEAMNPAHEQFELERLFETLRDVSDLSPQQRVEQVTRAVESFAVGAPPHDDVTLLYVQRTGA